MLRRDLTLAWRRARRYRDAGAVRTDRHDAVSVCAGAGRYLAARIAGGVVLVTVLLAMLLALDAMFSSDIEDGSLEQLVLAPQPLALMLGMKILAHWLTTACR
jgi:heme exporter protein B